MPWVGNVPQKQAFILGDLQIIVFRVSSKECLISSVGGWMFEESSAKTSRVHTLDMFLEFRSAQRLDPGQLLVTDFCWDSMGPWLFQGPQEFYCPGGSPLGAAWVHGRSKWGHVGILLTQ